MSKIDIDRWVPERWDQVVGNEWLVEHYQDMIRKIRCNQDTTGLNTLVVGDSGSGKTSITQLFARCLFCDKLDLQTLNPCDGCCKYCRIDIELSGFRGIEVLAEDRDVHYVPIDCTIHSDATITAFIKEMRWYPGTRLLWFDEADALNENTTQKKLLKRTEDYNFIWLLSTANPKGLNSMLFRRFQPISTELPTTEHLTKWLVDRCLEWNVEWDTEATLIRVAERANRVPSLALNVLKSAVTFQKILTRKHVERFIFKPT